METVVVRFLVFVQNKMSSHWSRPVVKRFLQFSNQSDDNVDYFRIDNLNTITLENYSEHGATFSRSPIVLMLNGFWGYVAEVSLPDEVLVDPSLDRFTNKNVLGSDGYTITTRYRVDDIRSLKLLHDTKVVSTELLVNALIGNGRDNKLYNADCDTLEPLFKLYNEMLDNFTFDAHAVFYTMKRFLSRGLESFAWKAYQLNPNLTYEQKRVLVALMNYRFVNNIDIKNDDILCIKLYDTLLETVDVEPMWKLRNRALLYNNYDLNDERIQQSLSNDDMKRLDRISPTQHIYSIGTYIINTAANILTNEIATDSDIIFLHELLDYHMFETVKTVKHLML